MFNINKRIKIQFNSLELLLLRRFKKTALPFLKLHFCLIFSSVVIKRVDIHYSALPVKHNDITYNLCLIKILRNFVNIFQNVTEYKTKFSEKKVSILSNQIQ